MSASAQREGLELIAVVMGSETSQDRFGACRSLLDYGFANFALYTPVLPSEATVAVKLGTADAVAAEPAGEMSLLVDKGQRSSITHELTLEESVTAPVSQGQRLGTLTVRSGEQVLAQIPMVAAEPVIRLTVWDLMLQILQRTAMAKQ